MKQKNGLQQTIRTASTRPVLPKQDGTDAIWRARRGNVNRRKRFPRSHAECEETRKHQGHPSPQGSSNTQQAAFHEGRACTEEALLGTTS